MVYVPGSFAVVILSSIEVSSASSSWLSRESDIRVMSKTSLLFLVMNIGSLPLLHISRFY